MDHMVKDLVAVARRQAGFLFALVTVSMVELGCQTVEVRSTADTNTDFSRFETFNFAAPSAAAGRPHLTEQNRQRIQAAVIEEMARRGCRLDGQAQLLFSIGLGTSIETYNRGDPTVQGGSMAANLSREYGLEYDRALGDQEMVHYTEGTLSFRAVETKRNRLVWEGQALGVLYGNLPDEEVQKRIHEAVRAVFTKFPIKPKRQ
jgi:hypothetical protein